jgi:sporulation related protein
MKAPGYLKKLLRPPAVFLLAGLLVLGSGLLLGYALFRAGGPSFSGLKLPKVLAGAKLPTGKLFGSKIKGLTKGSAKKTTAVAANAKAAPTPAATPAPAQVEAEAPPPPPPDYCLQLGAFTDLKKAQQLQANLKDRGYTAIIFEGIDTGYRPLHAVRISKFTDIDSATKAAADFTAKERLQAIVRPSDQL